MMRDLMERLDKVGWNILKKYLIALAGLALIPLISALLLAWGPNVALQQTLSIYALTVTFTILAASIVVLLALRRTLTAAIVMVVHEVAYATRSSRGEEVALPARAQRRQEAEAAAPEASARVSRVAAERVEKKPATTMIEKKCPFCGRVLPFGDIHTLCPYCGRRLR